MILYKEIKYDNKNIKNYMISYNSLIGTDYASVIQWLNPEEWKYHFTVEDIG